MCAHQVNLGTVVTPLHGPLVDLLVLRLHLVIHQQWSLSKLLLSCSGNQSTSNNNISLKSTCLSECSPLTGHWQQT